MNFIKLKEQFQTPLYVYDQNQLEDNMAKFVNNFKSDKFDTQVLFASKAFSCVEMYKICQANNMGIDIVSGGELYTAVKAGFDMKNAYFHGNNKTRTELIMALENGVVNYVVDNYMELCELDELALEKEVHIDCLLRLNVGIEAHTHKYIITASVDSKFGMEFDSLEYKLCMDKFKTSKYCHFDGFHSHIGSQIFDVAPFVAAVDKLIDIQLGFDKPLTINLGGGFGVKYTDEDKPIGLDVIAKMLISTVEKKDAKIKKLIIEPGRSVVGEAGYTLYTIGNIKETRNKKYYFIDGGMTDNIRPCLYQALYDCDVVESIDKAKTEKVSIAGKCCESGDIIIEDIMLPKANKGDTLVVYTTGAYGYSMSSNYNRNLIPAVVFVKDNKARCVIKRQSYEDLLRNDEVGEEVEI